MALLNVMDNTANSDQDYCFYIFKPLTVIMKTFEKEMNLLCVSSKALFVSMKLIYSAAHWSMISGSRNATDFLVKCIIRYLT